MFSVIICYFNALLAILGNGLLILLILHKSPRSMGNYKYLMLIFSTFGILFAIIDVTNQPMLHFHDGAYIIFSRNVLGLPRNISFCYIALNCSCYGMIMLLLVYHFVYRYLAVCKPHRLELFSYPYFNILIFIFLIVSAEWWISGVYAAGEDPEVEDHIKQTMAENYGLSRLDYTYASSLFYRTNFITGEEYVSVRDFLFVASLAAQIGTGFSIIIYCWLKLRRELIRSARELQHISRRTFEMQRQLFRSLVAQTLFPTFLMFIPAGILLCFPILKTNMGPIEVILIPLITTQPFMDAIVPMYFIKAYRMAVLDFFGKKKGRSTLVSSLNDDRSGTNSRVFSLRH
ncbi:hypothetical protein GCK72_006974 [Caenorhabditis remanei]|uniref:Serpentine receptor class r-10 n=1 Tax=Caenorhabditis remanei TaxID=31234 RepID=A0A6A5HK06_CAERE|nr:hypothetical protein GCK72_006974 [Caenorhabditis remanei]KAF1767016.1 hypothetical protein GCK72_006974 [Caenorhabditis remanei]